jgi:hypothetical protein
VEDLIVSNPLGRPVGALVNATQTTATTPEFAAPIILPVVASGPGLVVGDVDGDGQFEVLISEGNSVAVLRTP